MTTDFHERVRTGFLELARGDPERCVVIDAGQAEEEVKLEIDRAVAARFHLNLDLTDGESRP